MENLNNTPGFKRRSGAQILLSGLSTGTIMGLQALLGLISAVALGRILGLEGFGVYSFALALATVLAIPVKSGLCGLVVREVSRSADVGDRGRLGAVGRWATAVTFLYCCLVVGVAAGISLLAAPEDRMGQATAAAMLLVIAWSVLGILSGYLRGLSRPATGILPDAVIRPAAHLFLFYSVVTFTALGPTPNLAIAMHACGAAVAALWALAKLLQAVPGGFKDLPPARISWRRWGQDALVFAAIGGLQIANRQIDVILLGIMAEEEEVGLYRVALQGSMLLTFFSQAINIVLAPHFARHKLEEAHEAVWNLVRLSVLFSFPVAAVGLLVYIAYGAELIAIAFGTEFSGAEIPLVVLSAANALAMLNGAVVPLLNMTGSERQCVRAFGMSAILNVFLNLMLIPGYGMEGCAVAAFISIASWSLMLRRYAKLRLKIDPLATVFVRYRGK